MKIKKSIGTYITRSKRFLKYKSPTILSCAAAVGMVSTVVLAIKATPKAVYLLEERKETLAELGNYELTPLDVVKTVWKGYIPTVAVGGATLICIVGANALNQRNQTSLTSAYVLLDQSYKKYRTSANAVFGDDADKKIKAVMANEVYIRGDGFLSNGCTYVPHLDDSDICLFYDDCSRRYFNATLASVINAEYHINRNLQLRGWVSINEFYDFLGIPQITGGEDVGWNIQYIYENGMSWIDFENEYIVLEDGIVCYRICPLIDIGLYSEEW